MEGYIGEIRLFAGNFAPGSWALCQGQLMSIAEFTALFSIIGTTYGGDGQTTFALPDYRGRVALGQGQGPGLSNYPLGAMVGTENTTLTTQNLAPHIHPVFSAGMRTGGVATTSSAANGYMSTATIDVYAESGTASLMAPNIITGQTTPAGGSTPVPVMQPYLVLNVVICLEGIYPSRS